MRLVLTLPAKATLVMLACLAASTSTQAKKISGIDMSAYVMLDYDDFDDGFNEDDTAATNEFDIRRARLSFKAELLDHWKGKLKIDFSDDSTEIKDAYAQYTGWQWGDITIGQQKEPFGLEKLTSSRNLLMIERSLVSEALSPGRSVGVALDGEYSKLHWQLGYFMPDESESAYALTGRVSWLPWQNDNNLMHLGVAFSERNLNESEFRINERMEVYFADSSIEGKKLIADSNSLQSIELLWQFNGLTTMAEWQQASVTNDTNIEYDYSGGYLQLGYLLSGENRKYKNGTLGNVRNSDWEITGRYSTFDMSKEDQQTDIFSLGVNYFASKKLKFMGDYIHTKQVISGIELDNNNAFSLRMQYSF